MDISNLVSDDVAILDTGRTTDLPSSSVKKVNVKACKLTNHFRGPNPPHWVKQLYLEPLQDGWRREVVYRNQPARKTLDIYYYAPDGTKLRSRPEVAKYLAEREITQYSALFNFSFNDREFGVEFAPYETVRASKIQPGRSTRKSNGSVHKTLKSSPAPVKQPMSSDPLLCICSNFEKGNMIKCDNEACEIGSYPVDCIKMVEAPTDTWYCPICRGSDSSMINPAFAAKKVKYSETP